MLAKTGKLAKFLHDIGFYPVGVPRGMFLWEGEWGEWCVRVVLSLG